MADFTPTQGRYLSFIHAYIERHGYPPAEAEIAAAMCVSPPSVNTCRATPNRLAVAVRATVVHRFRPPTSPIESGRGLPVTDPTRAPGRLTCLTGNDKLICLDAADLFLLLPPR
jgi:hypothetical protein